MGGILLICSLIAIYLVVYWSIHIEEVGDKTKGFLGFILNANDTLHSNKQEKKCFLGIEKTPKTIKPPVGHATTQKINRGGKYHTKMPLLDTSHTIKKSHDTKKSFLKK